MLVYSRREALNQNKHTEPNIMKTSTLSEINQSNQLFHSENWMIGDSKIVAIHGNDQSTKAKYDSMPEGFILVSVKSKNGQQSQIGNSPQTMVHA
jgi:hypothetical protein